MEGEKFEEKKSENLSFEPQWKSKIFAKFTRPELCSTPPWQRLQAFANFTALIMAFNSKVKKSFIPANHNYLNFSAFWAVQTDSITHIRSITHQCEKWRERNLRKKIWKFVLRTPMKVKNLCKIYAPLNYAARHRGNACKPSPILPHSSWLPIQKWRNRSYQLITIISTSAHFELFKPINMCKISDPITRGCENRRTEIWGEKDEIYPSYNGKLKCTTTKYTLPLSLRLGGNSFTHCQFYYFNASIHSISKRHHKDFVYRLYIILNIFMH